MKKKKWLFGICIIGLLYFFGAQYFTYRSEVVNCNERLAYSICILINSSILNLPDGEDIECRKIESMIFGHRRFCTESDLNDNITYCDCRIASAVQMYTPFEKFLSYVGIVFGIMHYDTGHYGILIPIYVADNEKYMDIINRCIHHPGDVLNKNNIITSRYYDFISESFSENKANKHVSEIKIVINHKANDNINANIYDVVRVVSLFNVNK